MNDTTDIGPAFSPEENAFFESGGNTEIPAGDNAAGVGEGQDANAGDTGRRQNRHTPNIHRLGFYKRGYGSQRNFAAHRQPSRSLVHAH